MFLHLIKKTHSNHELFSFTTILHVPSLVPRPSDYRLLYKTVSFDKEFALNDIDVTLIFKT